MFKHIRPVWAEINLDNIAFNMQGIRKIAKSKDIIAVIKADAYGHGAADVAQTMLENGATAFAVAVLSEAIELRKSGIKCPIMILGYTPSVLFESLVKNDIEQTVFTYDLAKELSDTAVKQAKTAKVHIAVDTGMGRIGFIPNDESIEEIKKISKLPNIEIKGMFSHFSTADEEDKSYTQIQFQRYNSFYEKLKKSGINIKMRHVANSAAIMDMPEAHYEGVRPGIIEYGYYPSDFVNKDVLPLKPAMSLKANIVHIKKLKAGNYISYGRTFKTEKDSAIATLPIGYADGYSRLLAEKAKVIINGQLAPVVGRICMDQCMVDVTDIKDVKIGDEVVLMGKCDGAEITADDLARMLKTINYEVLCMIGKRVPRVYIKNGSVIKIRNYV